MSCYCSGGNSGMGGNQSSGTCSGDCNNSGYPCNSNSNCQSSGGGGGGGDPSPTNPSSPPHKDLGEMGLQEQNSSNMGRIATAIWGRKQQRSTAMRRSGNDGGSRDPGMDCMGRCKYEGMHSISCNQFNSCDCPGFYNGSMLQEDTCVVRYEGGGGQGFPGPQEGNEQQTSPPGRDMRKGGRPMGRRKRNPIGEHGPDDCCYFGCDGGFAAWVECENNYPAYFYGNTSGTHPVDGCPNGCVLAGGNMLDACIDNNSNNHLDFSNVCGTWQHCDCICPGFLDGSCGGQTPAGYDQTQNTSPPSRDARRGGSVRRFNRGGNMNTMNKRVSRKPSLSAHPNKIKNNKNMCPTGYIMMDGVCQTPNTPYTGTGPWAPRRCTSDVQCPKGFCKKAHWADSFGTCTSHGGGPK